MAHELRKNPKYSATGSSSLLSGWALPELRPLGPAPPPARCKLRKKRKKKKPKTKTDHRTLKCTREENKDAGSGGRDEENWEV